MINVLVVFGTRPEAIKLAPVIMELKKRPKVFRLSVCVTGQHRQMLDQVLDFFDLQSDYDLNLMRDNQALSALTGLILTGLDSVLDKTNPDLIIVQGDTTTTMATSMAGFYRRIKVAHVEAGLRTNDRYAPFPEEINRRITSVIADIHFAPTEINRQNLLDNGVAPDTIHVAGNTVIDALLWASQILEVEPDLVPEEIRVFAGEKRIILVTGHRRESFGPGFERICCALHEIVRKNTDVMIVYPVHLNPHVREPVMRILSGEPRICLIEPVAYPSFVWLMNHAYLVLTDSGGVQEEAPSLGKPVLVMRDTTERKEGVEAGNAYLVGTSEDAIINHVNDLLRNVERYRRMSHAGNPYGDGQAACRIADVLENILSGVE
ncbi:MAG: UDP-N-acetylglucosamine 2-epimerase (non-hydrolyzing) [Chloroflexi bacterium]|nr:UDP-N-acetylglucosamine 2-epimerase (non-hydrolyzing) [Chloroflexota bacterium]